MNWAKIIEDAIDYIEGNITEDLTAGRIAGEVNTSAFYFQRGFSMLCGYTVGEYVRMRRLSIAGEELLSSDVKVIDIAMKYGYDSPDSFTRAFTRFHGSTPTDVRRGGAMLKSFAPLHIKLTLDGGSTMEYRIEKKPAFKVMGVAENFSYENANEEVPQFWKKVFMQPEERSVMGMYGVCFDEEMAGNEFRYMIADEYDAGQAEAKKLDVHEIREHTWAVFPCRGPMPLPLQEVNRRIFSEWLPASSYEIAEGYNIEYYSNPEDFKMGMQDHEYYAEVWIPVKEK
ncbi:MAG TPA: AraC family transcriptional regulator [Lachnospiraceae bacterium]|nr:AraC family transcriptional regulator [Lachnospiraceae bacterium]